jgi:hypothetical protein
MCAEVDPDETDEEDQDRKYGAGGPPWKIGFSFNTLTLSLAPIFKRLLGRIRQTNPFSHAASCASGFRWPFNPIFAQWLSAPADWRVHSDRAHNISQPVQI